MLCKSSVTICVVHLFGFAVAVADVRNKLFARLRLHNKFKQHKTKLTVGTKSLNVAKVNIIEPGWPCKGHGDEEV